jgi:hypothetical protein
VRSCSELHQNQAQGCTCLYRWASLTYPASSFALFVTWLNRLVSLGGISPLPALSRLSQPIFIRVLVVKCSTLWSAGQQPLSHSAAVAAIPSNPQRPKQPELPGTSVYYTSGLSANCELSIESLSTKCQDLKPSFNLVDNWVAGLCIQFGNKIQTTGQASLVTYNNKTASFSVSVQ